MTSPADELRTAARRCRSGMLIARADLDMPLADWLDSAAEDAEQIGADYRALAVARQINRTP
ncbi:MULTISPECIES: hypothetical protein [unclassified Streptomyces]|uniref:hypothetical protein n=1 Tax=unclassified Streptomyces TaxID=2593676 RepID=UPI00081D4E4A|nr:MULTISPECIES: hypothetical protein [unclassified Streptomyces]MYZ37108.1 hypothetical protein [Streptomyces sp. SID4917]SCF88722.1 hypothetical protein GA0115259_1042210 [Streptomyces sp. MnatMP-M17]